MRWKYIIICLILLAGCAKEEERTYRIARDPSWFPTELLGREHAITVFSDELIRDIGRLEEFRVAIYGLQGHALLTKLQHREIDAILSSAPPIPQFRKYYDFSNVYLYTGPVLVVPEGSSATSLDDLAGKAIGIEMGTRTEQVIADVPQVVIRQYPDIVLALQALSREEIDGAVLAAIPTYAYLRDLFQKELKVVTPPLTDDGLRLLVLKGENPELVRKFNAGLVEAVKNGSYDKIAAKWQLDLDMGPQRKIGEESKGETFTAKLIEYWSKPKN